ncbi:hydrogenase maturation protease [Actinoplanes octamycinicus]|uniref:Hydrogenase maturation protease n=1 Tax=Actinoplanes octamycinicus TaxID=135948 RepID=A0A7W7MA98_9ACTN|nr:hydrogenase maturation protease [Actinoplanes octamycinicus]MBB4742848.1 hydrogenase maturation protease [Actinoplanes octamycinicus]GIE58299.1 peptidase M52 [Actinoplanes octamycinicus]
MVARRVVIGIGNEYRRDDGFGPWVVAELAARRADDPRLDGVDLRVSDGEPSRMLQAWSGADLAVLVDVAAGDRTGWCEVSLPEDAGPGGPVASGHAIGLGDTIRLARVLDRLPRRLVALVAYGREFGFGPGLSAPVAATIRPVTERICELVAAS